MGSSVFMCGMDVKGTFDAIPYPLLFNKTMNVLPAESWRFLYNCIKC